MGLTGVRRTWGWLARVAAIGWGAVGGACAAEPGGRGDPPASDPAVQVDTVEVVRGVRSRGRDPAVVALDLGGEGLCTGALVAPDVVLTARHCVARTVEVVECPARGRQVSGDRDAATIRVFVGDDLASARLAARGAELVVPGVPVLCDADVAALVLDRPVDVEALPVRDRGPARGEYVRAVGFGRTGDDPADVPGTKLTREHVRVTEADAREFLVGEATCQGDSGGPALDEETGAVVGIVSRGGPSCEGRDVHNVYTRLDAHRALLEEALRRAAARAASAAGKAPDAGVRRPAAKPRRPPSDVGSACAAGGDCATGICVTDGEARYCSRRCGTGDRCPNGFRCKTPPGSEAVCLRR